jgi:hypothetical protein
MLSTFLKSLRQRHSIYQKLNRRIRNPNFPEDISENIIVHYLRNIKKRKVCWNSGTRVHGDISDLEKSTKNKHYIIEVKCSSSNNGPISFGPKQKWDELFFLDVRQLVSDNKISSNSKHLLRKTAVDIYHIDSYEMFLNLKVNSNQSIKDQCNQNRRPRISPNFFRTNMRPIYRGTIKDILGFPR